MKVVSMVVFLLALVPVAANSALITWQIDVLLPEGGTVTGSFVYDASTNIFTDVNVSAVGEPFDTLSSPAGSSASLTSLIDIESNANNIDLVPTNGDLTNVTDVFIELDTLPGGMTDAGGIITVDYVSVFECLDFDCSNYNQLYYSFDSGVTGVGTVSSVPIPAAAWLFGSGILGLAGIARRKTSSPL